MELLIKLVFVAIMLAGIVAVAGCSYSQPATNRVGSSNQGQTQQSGSSNLASYSDIDSAGAKKMIDSNKDLQILDVREQFEYNAGHIANSKLISVSQLQSRVGELDKTKPVLVYCATGNRSRSASQILLQAGFTRVYNLNAGIMGWNYEIVK